MRIHGEKPQCSIPQKSVLGGSGSTIFSGLDFTMFVGFCGDYIYISDSNAIVINPIVIDH